MMPSRRLAACAMMAATMFDLALQLDLSVRLIVAAGLGALIGAEREIHGHPAGIRTHMLVALGSGIFTVMSIHGFGQEADPSRIDPTRIAAQIVSGIGFLGAGAILKDGIVIRGLTTAASLWATSAVGLAAGAGEYVIATVAGGVILISLWPINALAERLRGSDSDEIQLRVLLERIELVGRVSSVLVEHKLEIASITTLRLAKNSFQADLAVRGRRGAQVPEAIVAVEAIPGVEVVSSGQGD